MGRWCIFCIASTEVSFCMTRLLFVKNGMVDGGEDWKDFLIRVRRRAEHLSRLHPYLRTNADDISSTLCACKRVTTAMQSK